MKNIVEQDRTLFNSPVWKKCGSDENPDVDTVMSGGNKGSIAGVDEAGRGALAGPVCAAAVILGDVEIPGLNDSKKVSAQNREELYRIIWEKAVAVGVAMVGPGEIDRLNILKATMDAMNFAALSLKVIPEIILVDGNQLPKWKYESVALVKGDQRSRSIMAASIIAKVTRDRWMRDIDGKYPGWEFGKHKGYGVRSHLEMIHKKGPTHVHRLSFAPCNLYAVSLREIVKNNTMQIDFNGDA